MPLKQETQNENKETRQHLLECAKREFLEKGYMKASLRNICKEAGVTTGALYFFFKDKGRSAGSTGGRAVAAAVCNNGRTLCHRDAQRGSGGTAGYCG